MVLSTVCIFSPHQQQRVHVRKLLCWLPSPMHPLLMCLLLLRVATNHVACRFF